MHAKTGLRATGWTLMACFIVSGYPGLVEAQPQTVNLVVDFGAKGDGVSNDRGALHEALTRLATHPGGRLEIPGGRRYKIACDKDNEGIGALQLQADIAIVGIGPSRPILEIDKCRLSLDSVPVSTGTLAQDVPRGAQRLVIRVHAGSIRAGQVLHIESTAIGELQWRTRKQGTYVVAGVDLLPLGRARVRLQSPLTFGYEVENLAIRDHRVTVNVYAGHRVEIANVLFEIPEGPGGFVRIRGTRGGVVSNVGFREVRAIHTRGQTRVGLEWQYSVGAELLGIQLVDLRYGINIVASRDFVIRGVHSEGCHHPITPGVFSDTIHIEDLTGIGNGATMDAHPSFNVHYNRVVALSDSDLSGLRSVGGSIRNSRFRSEVVHPAAEHTLFQSLALTDPSIYDEYDFTIEHVEWSAPNVTDPWESGVMIYYGRRVMINDLTAPAVWIVESNGPESVWIENSHLGALVNRAPSLTVVSSVLDGDLAGEDSTALLKLWDRANQVIFIDTVFKNENFVIGYDYPYQGTREFINCSFINIYARFDELAYSPGHDKCYQYAFTDSLFWDIGVKSPCPDFSLQMCDSKVTNCDFVNSDELPCPLPPFCE